MKVSKAYYPYDKITGMCRLFCVLFVLLLCTTVCQAQKYIFTHYDIEDGLIQSQVNNIAVDHEHRLWMATYGGACSFDGKDFVPYTRQNGMPTNFVNSVFTDRDNCTWFGTQNGLVKLVNKNLIAYKLPHAQQNRTMQSIVQDSQGTIWVHIGGRLYKVTSDGLKQQWPQDTAKIPVTCIATDRTGRLYVSVFGRGLYTIENAKWVNVIPYPASGKWFVPEKIVFDRQAAGLLYLQTGNGIYTVSHGQLQPYESKLLASIKSPLLSMAQDADNNLWIGTGNGAYYLRNHQLIHFMAYNGLTDNPITDIFNDPDNNLWLASQGNGLYKYEGDSFITLDKSQGLLSSEVVLGITKDKSGSMLLGVEGSGLMRYDGKKLAHFDLPSGDDRLKRIQCLYTDSKGVLWIGTREGLWSYDGKYLKPLGLFNLGINGLVEDNKGVIWITTPAGCFYFENGQIKQLDDFRKFSSSIILSGRDSVMVGTSDGIALIVNKKIVKDFDLGAVRTSAVYCMLRYKNMLVMGTDDRGVFTWDMRNNTVRNYSLRDGLNSNTIYSVIADDNGVIWAGTGRGVNRLLVNAANNIFTVAANGSPKSLIVESNQNSIFYSDHKVYVGTTKGAVIYNARPRPPGPQPPHVLIQSVRLIPQEPSGTWANSGMLGNGVNLKYSQNHLAISFLGVYLKDPDGVSYRYKLAGLDTAYSALVKNNMVDYPSLPPGKYTFEVKAVAANGAVSANTAKFSFSITPPFYQTVSFRLAAISFFILLGVVFQNYRHRVKVNRQKIIEATKREENQKIRQQTAEDFHDELGNKLTRITVLSEILDTKMDQGQVDQKKLLEQIKQNAASLYNGTRDILWALDPQSDNLYEILNHIKDFGNELFLDTAVEFEFNGIDESLNEVKLPMEYSRNIPMIFKELLNNILKHAHATHVNLNLDHIQKDEMHLTLQDDGCGFTQNENHKGQGINNIAMRTRRIGGQINITSEKDKGTLVDLKFKINNAIIH